ncbi:MAG: LL-diaminopimelate aminotransferase [archaeon]
MVKTNPNYDKLVSGYLFPEINRRVNTFREKNRGVEVMHLGIGDTTHALAPSIVKAMHNAVEKLADEKTYTGYGDEQGNKELRKAIAEYYKNRGVELATDEVFVSDGAKCDLANMQSIFSQEAIIAVQDPVYPVYVDTNVIAGRTGALNPKGGFDGIVYMPCTEDNNFFPEVPRQKVDLVYLCSPNNPTGATATKQQLGKFVDYARKNKAIILFDAAYNEYISDSSLPKSIYQIKGAMECCIEINSFSKSAGFTGVRLGWTIVPKSVSCENAAPGKLNALWNRRQTTMFNGASNIAQEGGIASLSEKGIKENRKIIDYYMENARIIKKCFEGKGMKVFGGENAPYLWVKLPRGIKSWDFFDKLLAEAHVVCTPGSGFGSKGEGFVRLSAFGKRKETERAIESIKKNLKL